MIKQVLDSLVDAETVCIILNADNTTFHSTIQSNTGGIYAVHDETGNRGYTFTLQNVQSIELFGSGEVAITTILA